MKPKKERKLVWRESEETDGQKVYIDISAWRGDMSFWIDISPVSSNAKTAKNWKVELAGWDSAADRETFKKTLKVKGTLEEVRARLPEFKKALLEGVIAGLIGRAFTIAKMIED